MLPLALVLVASASPWVEGLGLQWSDWDGRQTCEPVDFTRPSSEEELAATLRSRYLSSERTKTVGAGHSFSGIALTDGHMVSLDGMRSVLSVKRRDDGGADVTVEGGIRLFELNAALEAQKLSLENLGATCEQSLAGATATGTHGTGIALGSLSTQIVSLRVISSNGTVLTASRSENPALFAAARVGLGSLGVVSTMTVRRGLAPTPACIGGTAPHQPRAHGLPARTRVQSSEAQSTK